MTRTSPPRAPRGKAPAAGGLAPVDAPGWEWRTFSRNPILDGAAARVDGHREPASEETYIFSARAMSSVAIRHHLVEVREMDRVSPDGLERWQPTLLAQFPLPARALSALYAAWAIEMREPNAPCWSKGQLMQQVVLAHQDLFAITVVKQRTHLLVGKCRGEHLDLTVNGEHWESLALDDADEVVVREAVAALGMAALPNTSFPSGLARIAGGLTSD